MTDLSKKPTGLEQSLNDSLISAAWLTASDVGAITLARRLAVLLDSCFDTGQELALVPQLTGKYLATLQQLHLTVDTRVASKQGDEMDGQQYVGDYLRLINTKDKQPTPRPAKRRAVGGATS